MNIDKNLFRLLRDGLAPLAVTLITGWLGALLMVVQGLLLSGTIAAVFLDGQTLSEVQSSLVWLAATLLIRSVLQYFQHTSAQRLGLEIKSRLRLRLMRKIFDLGPVTTQESHSGELTSLAMQGLETLEAYFSQFIPQLVLAAAVPLTILAVVFPLDLLSAVILLITAPLIPFFMILIGRSAEKLTQRQWATLKRLSVYFMDTIQGLTTLKILNRTHSQGQNISLASERYRLATMNVLKVTFLSALALEMLATLSTAIIAVQIGLRLLEGQIQFHQALFILVIAPDFYLPLRNLGLRFHAGINGVTIAHQLFAILDQPTPFQRSSRSSHPAEKKSLKTLQFENVCFSYPDRPEAALEGVSFTLLPGTVTALVGRSGAGKSTLFNLLLGFIQAREGRIMLDSISMDAVNLDDWRQMIAWVPQAPFLFNTTIAGNIVMGADDDIDRLHHAAHLAHLDGFIRSLPEQYETRTGEGGLRLSSGQAQRLALARAFYRDAPVLLMDEPDAFMDAETARAIRAAIRQLAVGRTTLIIAHHLETLEWTDQVLGLEAGRIVPVTQTLKGSLGGTRLHPIEQSPSARGYLP